MGKKKIINAKRLTIFVILAVLLIIIGFAFTVTNYIRIKKEEEKLKNRSEYETVKSDIIRDHYEEGEIIPEHDNIFARLYTGNVNDKEIYEKLYYFVNFAAPTLQKDLNGKTEKEIRNYFKNNSSKIKSSIGIDTEEDFVKLITYINSFELKDFVSANYLVDEFSEDQDYAIVPVELKFTKQTMTLRLEIAKRNGQEKLIIIKAL